MKNKPKRTLTKPQVEEFINQTLQKLAKEANDSGVPAGASIEVTFAALEKKAKTKETDEKWWVRLAERFPLMTYCAGKGDYWDKLIPLATSNDFAHIADYQHFLNLCLVFLLEANYNVKDFPKNKWGAVVGFSKDQTFYMPYFGAVTAIQRAFSLKVWAVVPDLKQDAQELTVCWGVEGVRGYLVQQLSVIRSEDQQVTLELAGEECLEKPTELGDISGYGNKLYGAMGDLIDQHMVNSRVTNSNPTTAMGKVENTIKRILGKEDTVVRVPDREIQRLVDLAGLNQSRVVKAGVLWTDGVTEILIKDAYRNFLDYTALRSKLENIPYFRKKQQEKDRAFIERKAKEEETQQKINAQKELEETRQQLLRIQTELDEARRLEELRQSEEKRLAQEAEDKRKAEEAELEALIKLEEEEKVAKAQAEAARQEQERIKKAKDEESRREQEKIKEEVAALFAKSQPPAPKPPPPPPPPPKIVSPIVKRDIQAEIWQFIKNSWFEGKSESWIAQELNHRGLKDAATPYVTEQHVKLAVATMEKNDELTFEAEQAFLQAQLDVAKLEDNTTTQVAVFKPPPTIMAISPSPRIASMTAVPSSVVGILTGPFSDQQKLKALSVWALKDNGEVANTCLGVLSDPLMPDDTKLPILLSLLE